MSDDFREPDVFRSRDCGPAILSLETSLKDLIVARKQLLRRHTIPEDLLNRGFGKRAAEVIEELIQLLNPERSENIRKMNAQMIWEVYWRLQEGRAETRYPIFAVLAELNSDPLFISDFAYTSY
ncbi:MAG: hypothetical protein WCT45_00105 [Candidatus Paceibacterota bacterium]|jgi:hypothetical protein